VQNGQTAHRQRAALIEPCDHLVEGAAAMGNQVLPAGRLYALESEQEFGRAKVRGKVVGQSCLYRAILALVKRLDLCAKKLEELCGESAQIGGNGDCVRAI